MKFIVRIALVFGLMAMTHFSRASHMAGSDMEYRFIGKDTLKITLRVYRDCQGIPINASPQVTLKPEAPCAAASRYVTMIRTLVRPVRFMCPGMINICEGGAFPFGMEENRFELTVALDSLWAGGLDPACCRLRLVYQECCRNGNITNINQGNFYVDAEIDRCVVPYNSSPQISSEPVAVVCAGQGFRFNNGIIDTIDHDSISYELADPLNGENSPETYNSGFSKDKPLNFLGFPNAALPFPAGFRLDAVTGDLAFTAMGQQQPVLAFKIIEWRKINGTYQVIGVTRRDVQFYTYQCPPNNPPELSANGSKTNFSFSVCAGNNICLNLRGLDKDSTSSKSDTTKLSWNNGIPGASFASVNALSNVMREDSAQFCWTPADKHISSLPYYFTLKAQDNNCPVPSVAMKAIGIKVKGVSYYKTNRYKLASLTYAFKTLRVDPVGAVADSIRWFVCKDPAGSFSPSNAYQYTGDSIVHTFDSIGTYVIRINYYGQGCLRFGFDTIVSNCNLAVDINPDTVRVCKGAAPITIYLNDTNGTANRSYAWHLTNLVTQQTSLIDSLNRSIIYNPNTGGGFKITGKAKDSLCERTDYAVIFVAEQPAAGFSANTLSGSTPLAVQFSNTSTGGMITNFQWSFGSTAINPSHTFTQTGYHAVWLIATNADTMAGISCKDSIYKAAYIYVLPPCNLGTSLNVHSVWKCADAVPVNLNSSVSGAQGTVKYKWTSINMQTQASVLVDSLNGNIAYTAGSGQWKIRLDASDSVCTRSDSALLNILSSPGADFSATPLTGMAPLNVQFSITGNNSSATLYLWSFGDSIPNPSHTFNTVGAFSVWLKAWRNDTMSLVCKDSVYKTSYVVTSLTGVREGEGAFLRIYPNPASTEFTVQLKQQDTYSFELYDYTGRILREVSCNCSKLVLERKGLVPGVYFLRVKDEAGRSYESKIMFE